MHAHAVITRLSFHSQESLRTRLPWLFISFFFLCETLKNVGRPNLVDQTTNSAALDVLHHQHTEGGSGHSGTVFVTDVGM